MQLSATYIMVLDDKTKTVQNGGQPPFAQHRFTIPAGIWSGPLSLIIPCPYAIDSQPQFRDWNRGKASWKSGSICDEPVTGQVARHWQLKIPRFRDAGSLNLRTL